MCFSVQHRKHFSNNFPLEFHSQAIMHCFKYSMFFVEIIIGKNIIYFELDFFICFILEKVLKRLFKPQYPLFSFSSLYPPLKGSNCKCLMSVPGPCEPEDLIDGIIFAANYLGSTQLLSERNPSKNIRMMQAQEAVSRVKVGDFYFFSL